MPLSEFYRMARGNLESAREHLPTNAADPLHVAEKDCFELVWENGQIVMQGQASKARRSPSYSETQYQRDLRNSTNSKMESVLTNFTASAPTAEMSLGQDDDDDMVPWMNYPMEDYCSGLLPEISGLTVAAQNSPSSIDKRNNSRTTPIPTSLSLEQANTTKQEHGQSSRSRSGQVYPWSFKENQALAPSPNSGMPGNSTIIPPSIERSPIVKTQKQNFMNFSHFSRPVALARVNLQKGTSPSGSNVAEPTQINPITGLVKEVCPANQSKDSKTLLARPIEESRTTNQTANVCQDVTVKNNKMENEIIGESAIRGKPDDVKNAEPVVATSSASGSSLERASNEPNHNLKRKSRETDESEGRSEDVEESVGIRKAAHVRGGVGSKRGRAAEVHNLSERRRRDRINEKMRALQELIPNCNKVDKASMLDEAIEYLKTLQLQVQIMSMGSGMYMPSMMMPAGMQHMHAAHMAQFSPMAVGMGMNMGYGMNMLEMSRGSHPMMHVPRVSGSHFAASRPPPISGPMGYQGMLGTNLQGFGHPSQGFPISAPHTLSPAFSLGASVAVQAPDPAPHTLQKTNSQMIDNADGSRSMNLESSEPTSDGLDQSTVLSKNNQSPDTPRGEDVGMRLS